MSSQCKRPLEHSVSSQPVKYLRPSAADQHQGPSGALQIHTACKTLQNGASCCAADLETSAKLWTQESALDRAWSHPRQQLSTIATVDCAAEGLVVEDLAPKQVMEKATDGREGEAQVGIAQDGNKSGDDREGNRHNQSSGTEVSHINNTMETQYIKKILEPQLLNGGRPMLVRMGEKEINLFALYTRVNRMGGYKRVTDRGLWATIASCLGLGKDCGPGVKLVYAKYLTKYLLLEVQAQADTRKPNAPDNLELPQQAERKETYDDDESSEEFMHWQVPNRSGVDEAGPNHISCTVREHDYGGRSAETAPLHEISLVGMVGWIKEITVDLDASSHHESVIPGQEQSFRSLAAKVRSLLWMRREELRTANGVLIQARQLPSPSVYYDDPVRVEPQAKEKLRTKRERVVQYGSQSPFPDHQPRTKRVPVGPDFQAAVKPWSLQDKKYHSGKSDREKIGIADETQSSDEESCDSTRWLGSRVWPLPGGKRVVNKSRDGHGRQPNCLCPDPGSRKCVKLHVETEWQNLKEELGQAFQLWGFDEMGECVATAHWTRKDEKLFKKLVRSNPPSLNKNFWNELPTAFPSRSHFDLVNYYFNVFVLQHRAIQNRIRGEKIDSDDDETVLLDSESDEDSSDDSFSLEDNGRGELSDAYRIDDSSQTKAPSIGTSSWQGKEVTVTHSINSDTTLTYPAFRDNGNDQSNAEEFLHQANEKVCCLNSDWKENNSVEEETRTTQGMDSLQWEHLHWANSPHLSAHTPDPIAPISSALVDG